jgi:hypothetical protein
MRRPERVFAASAALFAFVFAWILSGPNIVPLINWDNGSYMASIAIGRLTWSAYPWNNHMGIGQEYLIGVKVAHLLGLTVVDGFRLVGAIAFAAGFACIADTLRVVTRSYLFAALLTLAWATAWVNLHYHLIIEDNWLFLAPAAATLRICVLRADDWRWRDGVACGALVMVAFLGSWQALPYLAPAMWAALLAGPRARRWWERARAAAVVPAAFLASLLLWAALFVASSSLKWKPLLAVVFSRPEPSFLPHSAAQLWATVKSGVILDTLGTGVQYHLTFSAYKLSSALPIGTMKLGRLALGFQIALAFAGAGLALRRRDLRPHLLTAMLLLFTLVTSLHKDEATYAELKRYDFVPLYLVLIAGVGLGMVRMDRWLRAGVAALLSVIIVVQTAFGLRWASRERASYRTTRPWSELPQPATQLYGRDGLGWYGYFRRLRRENPHACRFVFVVTEFNSGWWNFDLMGALWSELPNHLTIGPPGNIIDRPLPAWRYPINFMYTNDARAKGLLGGCAWLSEDARRIVQTTSP